MTATYVVSVHTIISNRPVDPGTITQGSHRPTATGSRTNLHAACKDEIFLKWFSQLLCFIYLTKTPGIMPDTRTQRRVPLWYTRNLSASCLQICTRYFVVYTMWYLVPGTYQYMVYQERSRVPHRQYPWYPRTRQLVTRFATLLIIAPPSWKKNRSLSARALSMPRRHDT